MIIEEIMDTIKETPKNWWKQEEINNFLAKDIFDAFSKTKTIKKDWSIVPYCTRGRFGRCWSLNKENQNDRFWINVFDGEGYNLKETNYIYVDASFSFVFKYKGKNALYISFIFDNDKNLYIRQLQGFPNSSLHNKLGVNWKESAIYYIVNNFKMLKDFYLIEENSIANAVKQLYSDSYYNELHDPIIERIKNNYKNLRKTICFKNSKIHKYSFQSKHSTREFDDTFFKINKKKLANKINNC